MLTYDRGDPGRPRGHALVFFRDSNQPGRVLASYVVIPPVEMDFAKYVPPMFAGQFDQLVSRGPSAFPLPPIPEEVPGLEHLRALAQLRDDDLIDGGSLDARDVGRAMASVGEIATEYTVAHLSVIEHLSPATESPSAPDALPALDPDEILLDIMTDVEKVGRLAKLTGTLRYAVEGADAPLSRETAEAMERVGRRLPDHYRVNELVHAAQLRGDQVDVLVSLYVERCYSLAREEIELLANLDERIARLKTSISAT